MTDTTICKRLKLTPEQLGKLRDAARNTWQIIGGDILNAVASDKGADVDTVTMKRKDVLEIVLDASHIETHALNTHPFVYWTFTPKRARVVDTESINAIKNALRGDYATLRAALLPAFPYKTYGM